MADNGDITFSDVEDFVDLGGSLGFANQTKVGTICTEINSDVNLKLIDLGFSLPITESNSVNWLELTKKFGATALALHLLAAQDTEEENTRANWYWDRYRERIAELMDTGGAVLDAPVSTDPRPNTMPVIIGEFDSDRRKRLLRFPQLAAVDHYENDKDARKVRKWSRIANRF